LNIFKELKAQNTQITKFKNSKPLKFSRNYLFL